MKDSERLDLLKEIGGSRVYEERRRESLKIMQETGKWLLILLFLVCDECFLISLMMISGNKRNQIIQVVQYLDERLRELDEEKAELKKYQQLDKQRKSLEYTIYDREVTDARRELADVISFLLFCFLLLMFLLDFYNLKILYNHVMIKGVHLEKTGPDRIRN